MANGEGSCEDRKAEEERQGKGRSGKCGAGMALGLLRDGIVVDDLIPTLQCYKSALLRSRWIVGSSTTSKYLRLLDS